MAEQRPVQQQPVRKDPGLIGSIIGTLLLLLFLSIIVEWGCMTWVWTETGAEHAKAVMYEEFGWFSSEFQKSLIYSKPVAFAEDSIRFLHEWLLLKTGIQAWLNNPGTGLGRDLYYYAGAYIEAMFYVIIVFVIRLFIIILTSPLFFLAGFVGFVDGLVQRDLRKFGVGRESAFKYHHAKKSLTPIMLLAWILYLSIPFSIHPNFILIPAAVLFGLMIRMTASNFKKYL